MLMTRVALVIEIQALVAAVDGVIVRVSVARQLVVSVMYEGRVTLYAPLPI